MKEVLVSNDQLKWSMKNGFIPPYFTEAEIHFQPTYKYDEGCDTYDTSKKRRTPGWTDRILHVGNGTHPLTYGCVQDLRISDHRPVFGSFVVDIDCEDIPHPEYNEHGNHELQVEYSKDSQVCSIM